jgi:carboxypeptidase PM20D1
MLIIALFVLLAALLTIVIVAIVRAMRLRPDAIACGLSDTASLTELPEQECVERFREILRQPTVWDGDNQFADHQAFINFVPKLKELFPQVFATLELSMINDFGIMLLWRGKNPNLLPVVLMAHHDVVAADPDKWSHHPFAAEVVDGKIYARGAVDTKCILAAQLEAVSSLIASGFEPPRDIYICSSNCEEDLGDTAGMMVDVFRQRGITPALVLDEGGAVIDNAPLGVKCQFAVIGVSEKGLIKVGVTTNSSGGHAATPAPGDSTNKLVSGLYRLQALKPKAKLSLPVAKMFRELAAHGGFGLRLIFANIWLFRPLIIAIMLKNPETAAMLKTTYALTQLAGSTAANVIPASARASVNIRIDPHETVELAMSRLKRCFDSETEYSLANAIDPSPISPFDDYAFSYLSSVIHSIYPTAGIAPYIQSSASDARYFARICPHTYRFAGFLFSGDQRSRIHGIDENLDIQSYCRGVLFYIELIRNIEALECKREDGKN